MTESVLPQPMMEIFTHRVFRIPDYQRGYSWEEKQLADLLQDIELLKKDQNHFMGMLVIQPCRGENGQSGGEQLFKRNEGKEKYLIYDVIDGQQRLTSLVILLYVIHQELLAFDETHANHIKERYITVKENEHIYFTPLQLSEDNQTFFQAIVLNPNPGIQNPEFRSHRLLLNARNFFQNYFAKRKVELCADYEQWLQEKAEIVKEKIKLIVYKVENNLDAEVIFETLNDRGKPLTELEKVKNYLIYMASKMDESYNGVLRKQINDTWAHIFRMLDEIAEERSDEHEDRLLRAHWLMAYNYNPDSWQQSRSIKAHLNFTEIKAQSDLFVRAQEYLQSLRDAATAYRDIYLPDCLEAVGFSQDNLDSIRFNGEKLNRLGARATFIPLLMAGRLLPGEKGEVYKSLLELTEKFFFRVYEWVGYRSDAGRSWIYSIANRYYDNHDATWMLNELKRAILYYCPDKRFVERFKSETENWYEWGGIGYLLYEYEVHKQGGRMHMSWETITSRKKEQTIEHILPQTIPSPEVDPYWSERFTPDAHTRWVHDIGNLTLTHDNSSLSNLSFPKKCGEHGQQARYRSSPIYIENEIAERFTNWFPAEIQQRRDEIQKWAVGRWQVDLPAAPAEEELQEETISLNGDDPFNRWMKAAAMYGFDAELARIDAAAKELGLPRVVRKQYMTYKKSHGSIRTVIYLNFSSTGIFKQLYMGVFPNYPGVSREQIQVIFGDRDKWWHAPGDEDGFVDLLEMLARLVAECKDREAADA